LVRSIRLDFLGRCLFLAKTFDSGGWIRLNFLGFSRHNRYFSIGYADKTTQNFFSTPSGVRSAIAHLKPCETPWIIHGESVIQFPIFGKRLSTEGHRYFFNKAKLEKTSSIPPTPRSGRSNHVQREEAGRLFRNIGGVKR
jgi:hypothetical protein